MTSIISPWAYATQLAAQAQSSLTQAATMLRNDQTPPWDPGDVGLPEDQNPPLVGIPEQNGPDSPDNPWFVKDTTPIAPPDTNSYVLRLSQGAIGTIDQALALSQSLSTGVTTAFQRAKDEAVAGVRALHMSPDMPVRIDSAPLKFDAASLWLGLAKSLITLEHGGNGGSPIKIGPKLPEVEAPEAMAH